MIIRLMWQKILKGILHTEEEERQLQPKGIVKNVAQQ